MLGLRQPTAADQMRETGLMDRLRETPRGRPAVADDDAGEVLAEQLRETRGLTESRRRLCLASRPFQSHCTVPATFQPVSSGVTTGTPADCLAERVIRGLRLTRGAVYRVCTGHCASRSPTRLFCQNRAICTRATLRTSRSGMAVRGLGPANQIRFTLWRDCYCAKLCLFLRAALLARGLLPPNKTCPLKWGPQTNATRRTICFSGPHQPSIQPVPTIQSVLFEPLMLARRRRRFPPGVRPPLAAVDLVRLVSDRSSA
jgi:hypothetical protein